MCKNVMKRKQLTKRSDAQQIFVPLSIKKILNKSIENTVTDVNTTGMSTAILFRGHNGS